MAVTETLGHQPVHCDVIIVGGGPAGSVTAYLLSKAGFQVQLIEADTKPKRKVCGEFLCHEGLEILKNIGLFHIIRTHGFLPGHGAAIITPSGQRAALGLFPQQQDQVPGGYCLNRRLFDEALRREAELQGVQLHTGERVTTVLPLQQGWKIVTQSGRVFTCDLLVGADGIQSVVARHLKLTRRNNRKRLALRCFLPTRQMNARMIEMHLLPKGNYIGLDRVADNAVNYSIVVDQETLKAHGGSEQLIRHYYRTHPLLQRNMILPDQLPDIEAISPVTHAVKDCIAENAVLIGDAGGFTEPLTGDGIAIALWTASALSEQLILCKSADAWHQRNDYLKRYKQGKHRHYFQKRALSRLLYWLIGQEAACNFLCGFIRKNPRRLSAFMGVINSTYTPLAGLFYLVLADLLQAVSLLKMPGLPHVYKRPIHWARPK